MESGDLDLDVFAEELAAMERDRQIEKQKEIAELQKRGATWICSAPYTSSIASVADEKNPMAALPVQDELSAKIHSQIVESFQKRSRTPKQEFIARKSKTKQARQSKRDDYLDKMESKQYGAAKKTRAKKRATYWFLFDNRLPSIKQHECNPSLNSK